MATEAKRIQRAIRNSLRGWFTIVVIVTNVTVVSQS